MDTLKRDILIKAAQSMIALSEDVQKETEEQEPKFIEALKESARNLSLSQV
jgi:hypothetical protein